jgi:hypothetical protein
MSTCSELGLIITTVDVELRRYRLMQKVTSRIRKEIGELSCIRILSLLFIDG